MMGTVAVMLLSLAGGRQTGVTMQERRRTRKREL